MRQIFILFFLTAALPVLANPHAYNATPGYGVFHTAEVNPFFEVAITGATLATETTEPDGRKRLSFHFTVQNTGGGYQESVVIFFNDSSSLPWPVSLVSGSYAEAGDLAPGHQGQRQP